MELVNVFDWMELPEELRGTVSFGQNNPSYKRVDFSAFNTRSPQYALFFVEW